MAPGSHQPTCGSTHAPFHHHLLRSGRFASLGLIALLVACGGGGGSSGGGGDDPITYTVTANAGTGGSISPTSDIVAQGDTTSFTVTPDEGYAISEVTGCGGQLDGETYTTGEITEDCTVTATFVQMPPAATYGVGVTAVGIVAHHDTVGQTLTLTLNEEHDLVLDATDNTHLRTFTTAELEDGAAYEIVVSAHPYNQLCTVVNGEGTVEGQNVTEPEVHCHTTILNDTGIDWCADGGANNVGCPVAGYPGQDGDLGRDAAARDGTLTRLGGGAAGFDYTRIDADGNDLPADSPGWSCVRDNVTGLIWEVKVDDPDHLRHMNHTYSWYNGVDTSNGGVPGQEDGGSCVDTGSCDTEKFVAAVNAAGLCGASDWRMPTRNELLSLVHSGRQFAPAIDVQYFPNSAGGVSFWSSSSYAGLPADAWSITTTDGQTVRLGKTGSQRVRLVREAQ